MVGDTLILSAAEM